MVKVIWSKTAVKQLVKIDSRYQKAIKEKVEMLVGFPIVDLDIKKLEGTAATFRLRVGNYRVIFDVGGEPKVLEIQEVKRRQSKTY